MTRLFKDPTLQQAYDEQGYVTFPALGADVVSELKDYYKRLDFVDVLGAGYRVTLYGSDRELRRQAQEFLISRAFPYLRPFLVDRAPYMSTYLVKESDGFIIWAHQDWSHCDETKHDSAMCWIPLCDVDETNAALGFVKGSHEYFDYLRGFPYDAAQTPVNLNRLKVIPYLNLLTMKAGDAVVFNNKTIHGSLSNYTAEERVAISFALHPLDEPLLSHYIKPGEGGKILLKYEVTPDFYLDYTNPIVSQLYEQGKIIEGYEFEEVPYSFERVEWDELEERIISTGNHKDPWKVAKTEEFFGTKLYE